MNVALERQPFYGSRFPRPPPVSTSPGSFSPNHTAASLTGIPVRRTSNSFSGIANWANPQSRQTEIPGKTQTMGLSRPFSPRKWIAISPVKVFRLSDWQDVQCGRSASALITCLHQRSLTLRKRCPVTVYRCLWCNLPRNVYFELYSATKPLRGRSHVARWCETCAWLANTCSSCRERNWPWAGVESRSRIDKKRWTRIATESWGKSQRRARKVQLKRAWRPDGHWGIGMSS